ncbi:MAG TPA: SlyX family protein [Geobacteraceae bacterium]
MEERLTDLEIRLMHQERTLMELNDTVYRQEQAIERLERETNQLREQLKLITPSDIRSPDEEEPPPHY